MSRSRRARSLIALAAIALAGAPFLLVPTWGLLIAIGVWVLGLLLFSGWYRTSTPLRAAETVDRTEERRGVLGFRRVVPAAEGDDDHDGLDTTERARRR